MTPAERTDRLDAIRVSLTALQMRLDLLRVRVDGVARRCDALDGNRRIEFVT